MERSKETLVMFVEKNRYDEKKDFSEKKKKIWIVFFFSYLGSSPKRPISVAPVMKFLCGTISVVGIGCMFIWRNKCVPAKILKNQKEIERCIQKRGAKWTHQVGSPLCAI
jgi:hypothetical protein